MIVVSRRNGHSTGAIVEIDTLKPGLISLPRGTDISQLEVMTVHTLNNPAAHQLSGRYYL
jgi:hypothetical protein